MRPEEPNDLAIYAPLYAFVRTVPAGKVVTYGQAAAMTEGVTLTPRQVGSAMRVVPDDVPWQRVVGAGGHLPIGKRDPYLMQLQQRLLAGEGVTFLPGEAVQVDMTRCQWFPEGRETLQPGLFDVPADPAARD